MFFYHLFHIFISYIRYLPKTKLVTGNSFSVVKLKLWDHYCGNLLIFVYIKGTICKKNLVETIQN